MCNNIFNYQLSEDTVVFSDTLKINSPYISETPRNHESIFFVTNGTLLYEKQEKKTLIKEGQVGYIQKGSTDKSSAYLCDEVSYIAVNFCFDKENTFSGKTLPFETRCSHGIIHKYEQLFTDALNNYLFKTPGYITICNGIIIQIIGYLYNEHKMDIDVLQKMMRIENAVEYLKSHYDNIDFKINDLAISVNLSEKQFRRIFFDVFKKTPYAFLQEFRIHKAEILLSNTSKNISEIALQCGFCDLYSFSHCFKKHTGISPANYRKLHT